jgi:3-methylcrotonyl-CoA carboxylase alpha subunit
MKPIRRLLIANRGEIAARIQRTARSMGISSVAVFSDADRDAPFVRGAELAVRIGGAPSADSYLRIDRLIDAARASGADAIHPGFGFLAENADLAQAVLDAGLVFVGPSPRAIREMGSKKASKQLVAKAGVPVVPGAEPDDQSLASLTAEGKKLGYPLLVKASAGGGGKGMRIVHTEAELEPAIESAKREAKSAFGDETLLLEKYVERPRHVEIQVLGDAHGNVVHLFERECSIQRRHQKIVEETPSPALDADKRERMGNAAVAAARAVGYENAGTVEFILAPNGSFYFLEMNTRLQVEHPITECVTGVDIVREQLLIAQGLPLSFSQSELVMRGHAIECRLYAEDASNGFLPTTGTIEDWYVPDMPDLRVDTGVERGSVVGIHYDPMLAKVIVSAQSRSEAIQKMLGALGALSCEGVITNREFLQRVLLHPEFAAGNTHTHFIQDHLPANAEDPAIELRVQRAAIAALLAAREGRRREKRVLPGLEPGFRNNPFAPEQVEYRVGERTLRLGYSPERNANVRINVGGESLGVRLAEFSPPLVAFEDQSGVVRRFRVSHRADSKGGVLWFVHSTDGSVTLSEVPRFASRETEVTHGALIAPMPGKVVKVDTQAGQTVKRGDVLIVLEAMKMEHPVRAPSDGVVDRVLVAEGDQVEADAPLVVLAD